MRYFIILASVVGLCFQSNSQFVKRKLGPELNNHSFNYTAPFISLDGSIIVFLYDYTDDNTVQPFIALRQGVDWNEPVAIPRKLTALSFRKGFTFNPDGSIMYVTAKMPYSQGGFDILSCKVTGTTFSEPYTIGPVINSPLHDGSPTLSPDGNYMFFMRCNKMDFNSADDCKIMMAKKRNGVWETPTELPASINKGNSQMPRILGDGQTLVFSSNKHTPNKGGMDLYLTRMEESGWTEPINLDFVNTASDNVYSSATSLGISLLTDAQGEKKSELVEFAFPRDIKPKAVTRIIGKVSGIPDLTKAYVTVVDLESKQIASRTYADKTGNFECYITEGNIYGVFVDPPNDQFRYAVKRYDFREGNRVPVFDRMTVQLLPVIRGDVIELLDVGFQPYSSEIDPTSHIDLQKISKMMRGNPNLKFNVDVTLHGYEQDSTQSDDLTEVVADTVVYEKEIQIDSVTTTTIDSVAIEYTFHNDRTEKQAQSIFNFLIEQRIKPESIALTHRAVEEPVADKRKTAIYLRVNQQ